MSTRPLIETLWTPSESAGRPKNESVVVDDGHAGGVLAVDREVAGVDATSSRMLLLNVTVIVDGWKLMSLPAAGLVEVTTKGTWPPVAPWMAIVYSPRLVLSAPRIWTR